MAWTDLKAAVAAVIKTNGNQEITGALLQSTLNSIIDQVGANASYKGVAIPSTNPGTPDALVFYIASTQGTYANFGGFVLDGGFAVLSNVSGSWAGTKFLKTEMDAKAAHGYSGTPKTLKEVEDEIVQLAGEVNELNSSVEKEVSRLNNLNTVGYPINYFIGNGLSSTSPKYLFYNRNESSQNPKVENIVDVDSPFKDILGYVAKISNTYETNPSSSFLMSTSDYIGVIPERMDVSFWTKDSDFDSILEGFTPSWGFFSYTPTVLSVQIQFDIKEILAGETKTDSFVGALFDCDYIIKKVAAESGYSQILLSVDNIVWKNPLNVAWRPMMQFSGLAPKWVDKSFLVVNPQLIVNGYAEKGVYVFKDAENIIDFEHPESIQTKIQNVEDHVQLVEDELAVAEGGILNLGVELVKVEDAINDKFKLLASGVYAINQIPNIGKADISIAFLKDSVEYPYSNGYPKVENVPDTDSPFKGVLDNLTRFTNTQTIAASNFKHESSEHRTNTPTTISISYWLNKTQILDIHETFRLTLFVSSYTPAPILINQLTLPVGIPVRSALREKTIVSVTGTVFDGTLTTYKATEIDGWVQLIHTISDITWKLAVGESWKYGFGFNSVQPLWTNKSLDFANFQIVEDKPIPEGVYVLQDVSESVKPYPPTFGGMEAKIDEVEQEIVVLQQEMNDFVNKQNKLVYDSSDNAISYVESPFSDTHNIRVKFMVKRAYSEDNNPVFNFSSVALVNKATLTETVVHSNGDDICPSSHNSTYIGANHGCSDLRKVTVTGGHGKTFADIGSEWSNGTNTFYIVGIIDTNNLSILGGNIGVYPKWNFPKVAIGDTLTHVNGAANTASFVAADSVLKQFYPAMKVNIKKLIADGKEITESGTYTFDELNICEEYDILNVASTLEKIKDGVGTFSANPAYNDLGQDKNVRFSLVYKFTAGGQCMITTNFIAYQNISMSYFGFIQQGVLSGADVNLYIPKALPIMDGASEKDFRTIAQHNTVSTSMFLTSEYWENPLLPPDRWLQFSENIGLFIGYMFDYGVGGVNRKDVVNNPIWINTTRKMYPSGIDSKIIVNAGDVHSAVCFRRYVDRSSINQNGIISINGFEYEGAYYLYGDFNQAGFYEMDVRDNFVGRKFDILEKSDNVKILSEISSSKILVKVETSIPMYGYCAIRIN